MELYTYPDCLSNLAVEAFGKYVSNLLRQLVTFPKHKTTKVQASPLSRTMQTFARDNQLLDTAPYCQ